MFKYDSAIFEQRDSKGRTKRSEGVRGSAANDSETKDRIPPGVPNCKVISKTTNESKDAGGMFSSIKIVAKLI